VSALVGAGTHGDFGFDVHGRAVDTFDVNATVHVDYFDLAVAGKRERPRPLVVRRRLSTLHGVDDYVARPHADCNGKPYGGAQNGMSKPSVKHEPLPQG
jgi:hypothetical protein